MGCPGQHKSRIPAFRYLATGDINMNPREESNGQITHISAQDRKDRSHFLSLRPDSQNQNRMSLGCCDYQDQEEVALSEGRPVGGASAL